MRRASLLAAAALVSALAATASAQTRKIVIDPGHGGSDPGGVGTGMQEKNIVVDVGNRFKQLLDADSADPAGGGEWIALMTRDDDTFVSLSARSAFANAEDADRFMSIHSNAFGSASANGTETFAFFEGGTGAAMRNLVQEEMIAAWGLTNRGNKVANFAVLRETAMPAELHELAFITNATDAAKLASPQERQKAAEAHLRAIQRHFGIDPFIPGEGVDPAATGELAGSVVDDLGPLSGASVSLDGEREVVTPEDGSFAFTEVVAGSHTLGISASGHDDAVVEVDIQASLRSELEVVLTRTADGAEVDAGPGGPGQPDLPGMEDEGESGCGCRADGSRSGASAALLFLALVAASRARRRD